MKYNQVSKMIPPLLLASLLACDRGSSDAHGDHGAHGAHSANAKTKIVEVDGMRVVFDLMRMEDHHAMMKTMNVQMDHAPGTDYVLSLTLKDISTDALIHDARVDFVIEGPGASSRQTGQVMSGGGMHHFAADVRVSGIGAHKIQALIHRGERNSTAEASFQL